MSQHKVVRENRTYVFGWDQPLVSFFLQVHDANLDEEENPVVWLPTAGSQMMYEIEDLVDAARKHGLEIDLSTQTQLFREKDEGE